MALRTMTITLGVACVLIVAASAAAVGDYGAKFLGTWIQADVHRYRLDVVKRSDGYWVQVFRPTYTGSTPTGWEKTATYPATLGDRCLMVSAGMTLSIDPDTGRLLGDRDMVYERQQSGRVADPAWAKKSGTWLELRPPGAPTEKEAAAIAAALKKAGFAPAGKPRVEITQNTYVVFASALSENRNFEQFLSGIRKQFPHLTFDSVASIGPVTGITAVDHGVFVILEAQGGGPADLAERDKRMRSALSGLRDSLRRSPYPLSGSVVAAMNATSDRPRLLLETKTSWDKALKWLQSDSSWKQNRQWKVIEKNTFRVIP